jgi:hypothetical protein
MALAPSIIPWVEATQVPFIRQSARCKRCAAQEPELCFERKVQASSGYRGQAPPVWKHAGKQVIVAWSAIAGSRKR